MDPEELKKLGEVFATLGAKPKFDTKEDLEKWMGDYLAEKGKLPIIKTEEEDKTEVEKKKEEEQKKEEEKKKEEKRSIDQGCQSSKATLKRECRTTSGNTKLNAS